MRLRSFVIGTIGVVAIAVRAVAFDYPKDAVIYDGAVGTTKVKITASAQPFSRAAHKTTELRNAGTKEKQDWKSATVDGKNVVGTDQTLPIDGLPQLSALTVWFGEQRVSIPVEYLHHVFLPRLEPATFTDAYIDTLVAFSADGKALYLSLGVGDGGGAGTYDLRIRADGKVFTTPIQRPNP
ncbi:MAG: hypothetical protein KDK97_09520 [Verrucomicrobiales bacterium]|nr:hypothetical protein [Verrucomicrobiales bacterium]MCP5557446.1 hypothetical protein [Verrucomicrobiaceae bacterium]